MANSRRSANNADPSPQPLIEALQAALQRSGIAADGKRSREAPRATSLEVSRDVVQAASLAVVHTASRMAVAFSGGRDSSVLLDVCVRVFGPQRVVALHVAHGLQAAAQGWPAHCEAVARALGVECHTLALVGRPAPAQSVEEWAREARYAALLEACRAHDLPALLTAHHADDQSETLLMRLARGTGLEGLASIEPALQREDVTVLRPWLHLRRAELATYAAQRGLRWVEDPSNADERYTRNQLRARVMPALEAMSPALHSNLARTIELVREARTLLEEVAQADLVGATMGQVTGGSIMLDRTRIESLSDGRRSAVLRRWLASMGTRMPGAARLTDMDRQLLQGRSASARIEHEGWVLLRDHDVLRAWPAKVMDGLMEQAALAVAGRAIVVPAARLFPADPLLRSENVMVLNTTGGTLICRSAGPGHGPALDWLREQTLIIRAGRPGDRLRMRPNGPARTLKNLWQERQVPAWMRPTLPVVNAGEHVLYAAGIGTNTGGYPVAGGIDAVARPETGEAAREGTCVSLFWRPDSPEDPRNEVIAREY